VGIWNGGITVTMTNANASGVSTGTLSRLSLQKWDEDMETWENIATSFVQGVIVLVDAYAQSGQVVTANDPIPGLYRVHATNASGTGAARIKVDFNPVSAEATSGQAAISASSMDFFPELNAYISDPARKIQGVSLTDILASPKVLDKFDSLVVVNTIGQRSFLTDRLGLSTAQADAYYGALKRFADRGGNLVLTDASLSGLGDMGVIPPAEIKSGLASTTTDGQAASYQFNVPGRGNVCNIDPLLANVCLPGTAGGSQRVAVEPTPLGYAPDGSLDSDPAARIRQWWVQTAAWQNGCGKTNALECTSALMLGAQAGIGERVQGQGVVRIVGAMFPDPNYAPKAGVRDMRYGLQDYALSFSAWQVFLNLVDYQRPARADLSVKAISTTSKVAKNTARITVTITNNGTADAPASTTNILVDGKVLGNVATAAIPAGGSVQVSILWSTKRVKGQHVIRATADSAGVVDEMDEDNNVATLTVSVKDNVVKFVSYRTGP
jgi:archaellum component FlaF (FlaF/FlaG flagellin family)